MTPTFIQSFRAASALPANTIATFATAATTSEVEVASANTDALIGVVDGMGGTAGSLVDIQMAGIVGVKLGASVQAGQPLTADSNGAGVPAAASTGNMVRTIGHALEPGVSGDIIDVWLAPGIINA